MTQKSDIWNDYPEELLQEAEESRAAAEAALLAAEPCVQDPYDVSMAELLRRWRERQSRKTSSVQGK